MGEEEEGEGSGERGAEMKGATAARPGSAATGEREGSGNLKVKMQITQPGDGNPVWGVQGIARMPMWLKEAGKRGSSTR